MDRARFPMEKINQYFDLVTIQGLENDQLQNESIEQGNWNEG